MYVLDMGGFEGVPELDSIAVFLIRAETGSVLAIEDLMSLIMREVFDGVESFVLFTTIKF
jgi:hypothetical protein